MYDSAVKNIVQIFVDEGFAPTPASKEIVVNRLLDLLQEQKMSERYNRYNAWFLCSDDVLGTEPHKITLRAHGVIQAWARAGRVIRAIDKVTGFVITKIEKVD